MALGLNKVLLIGFAGKDPIIHDNSGLITARFSLATGNKYKDKNTGQLIEDTEWHNIVCFSKLALIAQKIVKKGCRLYIEGSIKSSKYFKDNYEKLSFNIIAKVLISVDSVKYNNDGVDNIEIANI
jgi:single-strand DNA-binding protein